MHQFFRSRLLVTSICSLLLSIPSISQTAPKQGQPIFLYANANRAFASTGDNYGLSVAIGVEKQTKKRGSITLEMLTTIHDDERGLFFEYPPGGPVNNGSIRTTTAGVQLAGMLGHALVKTNHWNLIAKLGALVRYQSTSIPDSYEIQYPAMTNLPYPVIVFDHWEPMRTYAVGGIGKLALRYNFNSNLSIEASSAFQADSNGDNFAHYGLSIGCMIANLRKK